MTLLERAEELFLQIFIFLSMIGLAMLLVVVLEPKPYLEQYISMDYLTIVVALILMAYLAVKYVRINKQIKGC